MKKKAILLLFFTVLVAFWQVVFLKFGMKWDFVDAFLPSRYFFSESVLNNQFPLWNPYLLYGTPVFADLVSVFSPEFWLLGNLVGYSNITLQFLFVAYGFIAGISFFYFLKQFNSGEKTSLAFSVAYMLSGFTVGNAQHLAFVAGYAILPFLLASYTRFTRQFTRQTLLQLALALFLMIYASYPGLTIVSGYFLLAYFIYALTVSHRDKKYLKTALVFHAILTAIVVASCTVLIVAYLQGAPYLSRYGGISTELANKHPFSVQSLLSFLFPMATAADAGFFKTDPSMSNGYFGIISLALFIFVLTRKARFKESYVFLATGIFALLASFGSQFFLREFLYNYFPLMNMFQYPGIFRAFAIFGFLAFTGINLKVEDLTNGDRKRLFFISFILVTILCFFIANAMINTEQFIFFNDEMGFREKLIEAGRSEAIIFQGIIQLLLLGVFVFFARTRIRKYFISALLVLFITDGIISTQLNIHHTVVSDVNPLNFYRYLKSSPRGFPIPELNPIGENSDRSAQNEFVWMNNNVFPKKVTFDGLISFKLDGYKYLSDNHPELLEEVKKQSLLYFGHVGENMEVSPGNADPEKLTGLETKPMPTDQIRITAFSPTKTQAEIKTSHAQILVYQQNYFKGWKVFIDEEKQELLRANFTHMAVLVPPGNHVVRFEFKNHAIIVAFGFSYLVFFLIIGLIVRQFVKNHPEKNKQVLLLIVCGLLVLVAGSALNRFCYEKNKMGMVSEISATTRQWKAQYGEDLQILLSSTRNDLKHAELADTIFFVNENTRVAEFSRFLMRPGPELFGFGWHNGAINNDLFELVYSFYPTVAEKKTDHNSGYLLVRKSPEKPEYIVFRDFEPGNSPEWEKEPWRLRAEPGTGNHFYLFDANDEWGTTFEIPVDENLSSPEKITVLTDFRFEHEKKEVLLVFTTIRDGQIHLYEVSEISRFAREPGVWYRGAFTIQNPDLRKGDKIAIYFWNQHKTKFSIDNFKIATGHAENPGNSNER